MFPIISVACLGQVINPGQPLTREDYLIKSKNQKSAGGVLAIGGTVVSLVGITMLGSNILVDYPNSQEVKNRETTGLVLLSAGGAAIVSGIIFLTASKRNRRKAATIELQQQNSWRPGNKIISNINYPALTFRLKI